jgi:hypothetical protein
MGVWHDTIPIKDLLGDDDSDAEVGRIALIVHERLANSRERMATELPQHLRRPADMDEYDSIVDEFHTCGVQGPADGLHDRESYFNDILVSLYDWADDHRVWIA